MQEIKHSLAKKKTSPKKKTLHGGKKKKSHQKELNHHPEELGLDQMAVWGGKRENGIMKNQHSRLIQKFRQMEVILSMKIDGKKWREQVVRITYITWSMLWALVLSSWEINRNNFILFPSFLQTHQYAGYIGRHWQPIHLHCHLPVENLITNEMKMLEAMNWW